MTGEADARRAVDGNAGEGRRLFDDGKPHSPREVLKRYAERKYTQYTKESEK